MSFVRAFGAALPERVVDNEYLAPLVGESAEWILSVCGIEQRRYASDGESVASLAVLAARECLAKAGVDASDVGMLIVASGSAERFCPGPAVTVAAELGMVGAFALDVPVASAGSLIAMGIAVQFAPTMKKVLVVASEIMSRRVDLTPEGKNTAILFGDGAGACLIDAETGFLEIRDVHLASDGMQSEILKMEGERLVMEGLPVIKYASQKLPATIKTVLARNSMEPTAVGTVLMHQANRNLITRVATATGIPLERFYLNIERYGNTSSASMLIAAAEWREAHPGAAAESVVFAAFGAGIHWGSVLACPV